MLYDLFQPISFESTDPLFTLFELRWFVKQAATPRSVLALENVKFKQYLATGLTQREDPWLELLPEGPFGPEKVPFH